MTKKQRTTTAWTVVIIAFFGGFALANVQNKVPPVIDVIMTSFNIGETDAGWLTSVFTVMGMVTAIPASQLMRKLGSKKIGVISLAFAAAGSAIGAFAPNLTVLMITRVIEGVGVGMIAVVGPVVISEWFPPEKRGLPMGLWGSWMMCSQTLLFLVGGIIASSFSWQGVWWFCCIFCVVVLILCQLKVEDPPEGAPNYAVGEGEDEFHFGEAFKSASTWMVTLAGICFCICTFGFATYISLYWHQTFGVDMNTSNTWVSILYAIEVPMVIFIGWFMNHVGLKKRHWVGVVGNIVYAGILFICFRMNNPAFIIPFIIIYPFLEGIIPTVYWTLAPSTAKKPEYAGTAIGILNVGLNIGTLIGPPLTGYFIETAGWAAATVPLVISAIVGAIAFALVKTHDSENLKLEEEAAKNEERAADAQTA